jgi:hypothetical protein
MQDARNDISIGDMDPRLLEEAFRRARQASSSHGVESAALLTAIITEARRGTRDMFSLVAAATRSNAKAA